MIYLFQLEIILPLDVTPVWLLTGLCCCDYDVYQQERQDCQIRRHDCLAEIKKSWDLGPPHITNK